MGTSPLPWISIHIWCCLSTSDHLFFNTRCDCNVMVSLWQLFLAYMCKRQSNYLLGYNHRGGQYCLPWQWHFFLFFLSFCFLSFIPPCRLLCDCYFVASWSPIGYKFSLLYIVLIYNMVQIVCELPVGTNWNFDVHWYPKSPGLISASSFDGKIEIYNIEVCSLPLYNWHLITYICERHILGVYWFFLAENGCQLLYFSFKENQPDISLKFIAYLGMLYEIEYLETWRPRRHLYLVPFLLWLLRNVYLYIAQFSFSVLSVCLWLLFVVYYNVLYIQIREYLRLNFVVLGSVLYAFSGWVFLVYFWCVLCLLFSFLYSTCTKVIFIDDISHPCVEEMIVVEVWRDREEGNTGNHSSQINHVLRQASKPNRGIDLE